MYIVYTSLDLKMVSDDFATVRSLLCEAQDMYIIKTHAQ